MNLDKIFIGGWAINLIDLLVYIENVFFRKVDAYKSLTDRDSFVFW